jgi:hypothetical protein
MGGKDKKDNGEKVTLSLFKIAPFAQIPLEMAGR